MGKRYLQPLLQANVDTIVLGCTHYPILKKTLSSLAPTSIQWIDSGSSLAAKLLTEFSSGKLNRRNQSVQNQFIEVVTTDSSEAFIQLAQNILLPLSVSRFSHE